MIKALILVPVRDNGGRRFATHQWKDLERRLAALGGFTLLPGVAAGGWMHKGQIYHDRSRQYLVILSSWFDLAEWLAFRGLAQGMENPPIRAAGRVTLAVMTHPLYIAVRDLEDRLGLRQGELEPGPGERLDTDPLDDEWLRAGEAARRKGVTLPGLHQAIQRGQVIARPAKAGGAWRLVSRKSLDRWMPHPARQAAGRLRGRAGVT